MKRAVNMGAFLAGYLATWFLSTVLPTPLLWYFPIERRFTVEVHPVHVAADFYGRVLLCLLIGALTLVVCFALTRRRSAEELRGALPLVLVWCLSFLLLTVGLYGYQLSRREPVPLPLPAHAD